MKVQRRVGVLISFLGLAVMTVANAASVSPAPSTRGLPTSTEVTAAIKAAETQNKVPKGLITPPLTATGLFWTSINPSTGNPSKVGCIINDAAIAIPADVANNCAFGDTTSNVTIALVGDSNANAWIPAFDTWGYVNHVKVVAIVHAACAPWDRPWLPKDKPIWGDITERKCASWRASMLARVAGLSPKMIFPVGIASTDKQLVFPTQSQVQTSMVAMVKKFGSKNVALIEPVPQFSLASAVLSCITAHGSNLRTCSVPRSAVAANFMNKVVKSVSGTQGIPVVNTQNLFCGVNVCPIFATLGGKNYLIYEDGYHISHQYSQIIGSALPLKPIIK